MVVRALYFLGLCNRPSGQADQRKHNLCGRSLHTGSHNGNHGSDTYAEKPQAGQASQQRRKVAWHYIRPQTGADNFAAHAKKETVEKVADATFFDILK